MTESIFVRVKRIISASIYDTVDIMERAGGASVMREAIREVERVADEVKSERNAATAERLQAIRLQGLYKERLETLEEKAAFAVEQGREDLAEAALTRQLEFENQIEALATTETNAAEKERRLEESLASLTMRKAQMEEELKAFEMARAEAGLVAEAGKPAGREAEDRVERAEAAFDRALNGAGGAKGISRGDMGNAAKIAEIDVMQKQAVIANRLAALRERKKAS